MNLRMNLGPDSYEIVLKRGTLQRAGEFLNLDRKVLIVTDDGVPTEYAEAVASCCRSPLVHVVPQGEGSKDFSVLQELLIEMLNAGFTRDDCVCAVGGGVVGDLSGFAAACYMRGIDFYNIPTTILAQVDSSIGGKTAVNLAGVKNIAGAFWQPRGVLIDPDTLSTLSKRLCSNGLSEALKAGVIADEALFELFEKEDPMDRIEQVIEAALRMKKAVVEADEKEKGLRRILNFGHTIGHGIESVTGLLHGECVALGMLPMCSENLRERLLPILKKLDLPTVVKADPAAVYQAMLHDKKMKNGGLMVVLSDTPGSCRVETLAPEELTGRIEMVVKP